MAKAAGAGGRSMNSARHVRDTDGSFGTHPDLRVVTARSEAYSRAYGMGLSQVDAMEYAEAEAQRVAKDVAARAAR